MNKFITPGKTKIVKGTILAPENAGLRFVINIVGQDGTFNSDLDKILAKKYNNVKLAYKEWYATQLGFKLGAIKDVAVSSDIWIKHLLVRDKNGNINDAGLQSAIKKLGEQAKYERASVHVSTMLTKNTPQLESLLIEHLVEEGITTYFYDEP
jgi:hypothetical protein